MEGCQRSCHLLQGHLRGVSCLYILYTNNCNSQHNNRYILKCAADSAIVSLLHASENYHSPVVDDFVAWCDRSYLHIHVSKTKGMVIDFRS